MPISDEKRYEFITEQLRYVNEKIIEAFQMFVKIMSAIVAGLIILETQDVSAPTRTLVADLLPWLFLLVGLSSLILILVNLRSWWGYRIAESALVGRDKVPPPRFPRSCSGELVMMFVIVAITLMGILYVGGRTESELPPNQVTPPDAARTSWPGHAARGALSFLASAESGARGGAGEFQHR